MVDIECNTRGQSQSKLWFHEWRDRLTASHFCYSNQRECFLTSLLRKILLPASNVTKPPEACQVGQQEWADCYWKTFGANEFLWTDNDCMCSKFVVYNQMMPRWVGLYNLW
jgi:hypothetical protein